MSFLSSILPDMKFTLPSIFPIWTRNKSGESFYDLTAAQEWYTYSSNLGIAQSHPILTPAILFVAKLFSQAEFKVERLSSGKEVGSHNVINLFKKPNYYQTLPDLLESLLFTQIANGVGVLYAKRIIGFKEPTALYVLNYALIKWPDDIDKNNFTADPHNKAKLNTKVIYDEGGENLSIRLGDLLFFYDLPNAVSKNPFKASSRITGLKQTLINTKDSLIAKNIILKTNGKELITGNKEGFNLDPTEKAQAEALFSANYGLSRTRKRGLITKAHINHKSLHIALRDLGLDESVKVDGNIIYTAMHIPKDIISLEAKKTTYNNFKESMVSYIQNEIQPTLDSFVAVVQEAFMPDNVKLVGSYEHLPIMQFILIERYDGVLKQAQALSALRNAGLPDDVALERAGFDKSIKLSENIVTTPDSSNSNSNSEDEEKEHYKKLLEYEPN